MAAPIGNKFWELRSKHGRDKLFASSDLLWKAACDYFNWCQSNPLIEVQQAKATGKPFKDKESGEIVFPDSTIQLPKMRPFTMIGLCHYLDCNLKYFDDFEKSLKDKQDKKSRDFSRIITRTREVIYNQKFTGAAAGFLNPNIIARDLGLIEKKDVTNKIDFDNLTDEQLDLIINTIIKKP